MQKMLTSVEGCPIPSVRSPAAGAPVSVIVWAPPPAGPKAPGLRCTQSGYAAGQAVLLVHAIADGARGVGQAVVWSPAKQPVPRLFTSRQKPQKTLFWPTQVPAPAPVQQLKGCIAAVHCAFAL